jgi:hypothetical protein
MTAAGATGGVHVTYLAQPWDVWEKAALDPPRRMWGPQTDADGAFGGAFLGGKTGGGPWVVAEGIENALSAAILLGKPCRPAAALSLNRLQGGWLADQWGRRDSDAPAADPEAPGVASWTRRRARGCAPAWRCSTGGD